MPAPIVELISERSKWARENRDAQRLRDLIRVKGCQVYAAGGYGQRVARALVAGGYPVRGFIDAGAQFGQTVAELPCVTPAQVASEQAAQTVLVIGINNFRTPVDGVISWAENTGFTEVVLVPELPDLLGPDLGNYWQASRQFVEANASAIARVDALLADERSREIFRQLVSYRITGRPEDHPPVDRERQYFPADLPMDKTAIVAIDCGAFPGDLVQTGHAVGTQIARWFAFEPDPANFKALSKFATSHASLVPEAVLFPCGVGGSTGSICFSTGNADASRAAADGAEGTEVLPVVRIDDVLRPEAVDLVKVDIEGFEDAALDGMAGLLARHRPRLAMAIYHKPADLWELPLKVDAMMPGGRFAIRQHGYNGYDTVLYVDWD